MTRTTKVFAIYATIYMSIVCAQIGVENWFSWYTALGFVATAGWVIIAIDIARSK